MGVVGVGWDKMVRVTLEMDPDFRQNIPVAAAAAAAKQTHDLIHWACFEQASSNVKMKRQTAGRDNETVVREGEEEGGVRRSCRSKSAGWERGPF